jgi:hypothetical protein
MALRRTAAAMQLCASLPNSRFVEAFVLDLPARATSRGQQTGVARLGIRILQLNFKANGLGRRAALGPNYRCGALLRQQEGLRMQTRSRTLT